MAETDLCSLIYLSTVPVFTFISTLQTSIRSEIVKRGAAFALKGSQEAKFVDRVYLRKEKSKFATHYKERKNNSYLIPNHVGVGTEKHKLNILQTGTSLTHKIHFLIVTRANGNRFPQQQHVWKNSQLVNKHFTLLQAALPHKTLEVLPDLMYNSLWEETPTDLDFTRKS